MVLMLSTLSETLSQYWWILIVLFSLGLVFCAIETFTPSFGVLGIFGIIMFALGIVYYALMGAKAWEIILVIIASILFIAACFFWVSKSVKNGILSRSPFFDNSTSLPVDYDKESKNANEGMLGKIGIVETDLHPVGNVIIDGKNIEVYASVDYIPKGCKVKVTTIDSDKIIVEEVKKEI